MVRISLRIDTLEVPAQDIVTHDNVTVKVKAVVLFHVIDAGLAVLEVNNFLYATSPCQNSMEIIKYRLIGGWRRVLCCRSDLE